MSTTLPGVGREEVPRSHPWRQRRVRQCGHQDRGLHRRERHVRLRELRIDGLFREQASEVDPKRREATLHRIQHLVHDKAMVAPIWLNAGMNGVGPRVEESGIGLVAGYIFSAPYEDVKLRGK